jgi:hypothetical protein
MPDLATLKTTLEGEVPASWPTARSSSSASARIWVRGPGREAPARSSRYLRARAPGSSSAAPSPHGRQGDARRPVPPDPRRRDAAQPEAARAARQPRSIRSAPTCTPAAPTTSASSWTMLGFKVENLPPGQAHPDARRLPARPAPAARKDWGSPRRRPIRKRRTHGKASRHPTAPSTAPLHGGPPASRSPSRASGSS